MQLAHKLTIQHNLLFQRLQAAAAVAAEFVSAINSISNFTSDGNYAVDNGDGTVTIQWASADSIANHAVSMISAGTTGIGLTAGSALPDKQYLSEIAAVVASQLNAAFSDNKIFRTASNIAGSSGVTLTFRDSDGAALPRQYLASDTTGAFDDFTASNTVTTGNIYVGGVTVSIAPGTTAHNVASAVQTALQVNFASSSAFESRVVVNEGSGSITITYPDEESVSFPN